MTDPKALAALYTAAFPANRPWSASEFETLITRPGALVSARAEGYAIGQQVLDEAELLSIAVHPDHRRKGLGATLLTAFEAQAQAQGATRVLLEVSDTNTVARALYQAHGWQENGRRKGYYPDGSDALMMEKLL